LKEILSRALGVLVIVDKIREIYFIENVKFHIDIVKNLGTFLEIEAIGSSENTDRNKLLKQCNFFISLLHIQKSDLVSVSYSDLLMQKANTKKLAQR